MEKLVRLSIRVTIKQDKKISDIVKKLRIGNHEMPKAEYVRGIITKSLSSNDKGTDIVKSVESDDKIKVLEDRILELIGENKKSDKKIKELTDEIEKVKKTKRKQEVKCQIPTTDDDDVMTAIKSLKVLIQDMSNTIDTVDDVVDDTKQVTRVHNEKASGLNKKVDDIADEVHNIKELLNNIVTTVTSPKEYQDLQDIKDMLCALKSSMDKIVVTRD